MTALRLGIAGLGAASRLVLPATGMVEGVRLAGAADMRPEARGGFERDYGLPVFDSVEDLCASRASDAVWIETPNHLHAAHVLAAAKHGVHVICAKPLATNLAECDAMIEACRKAGVKLLLGHSKVFDPPVRAMAEIVGSGRSGRLIAVDCLWFNDWLRRPRLASELDESLGAGFILRQAPHLVDIACYIAGERAMKVRAMTGRWNRDAPVEGNVSALIGFESGATAHLTLNGYGYFQTSELTWDIGIRQSPNGLYLYTDEGREEISLPPYLGRAAELIELRDAIAEGRDVFPNGEWGKANLEICLSILTSARENRDVELSHQAQPSSPVRRQ